MAIAQSGKRPVGTSSGVWYTDSFTEYLACARRLAACEWPERAGLIFQIVLFERFDQQVSQRRGWDSNPRYLSVHSISSRAHSTTLPPLQGAHLVMARPYLNRLGYSSSNRSAASTTD